MIKRLLWFCVMSMDVFVVCISAAQDNELIIVDETPVACGNISILQVSSFGTVRKEMARDDCSFNITDNGHAGG